MSYRLRMTFEAFQVRQSTEREEPAWFKELLSTGEAIETDEGYTFDMPHPMGVRMQTSAKVGDWIMQRPHGVEVIDAQRFQDTYEEISQ